EHLLRRVDRVTGDLHHDRRGVRLQRLAELVELVFLKPESRSFETRAPIEPPARIPIGPPMMPIAPPSSAPRPAPQSFDATNFALPSGRTKRTAVLPISSRMAPPSAPAA